MRPTEHGFVGPLAGELEEYIRFKASMGRHGATRVRVLRSFDRHCLEHGAVRLERGVVERWIAHRIDANPGGLPLVVLVHQGLRQVDATGPRSRRVRALRPVEGRIPASDAVPADGPRGRPVPAGRGNVGVSVAVVDSKAGRSRRLPVGDEVAAELLECDQRSRERFGDDRPAFFVTSTGNPVSPGMPGVVFRRVWTRAGLEWPQAGKRPRPYDFRHRFAFANIERWTRDGVDVMAMLPYLAAYMGHAGIDSTLYYVHASPDFMDGYADLVADAERVVPETEEP